MFESDNVRVVRTRNLVKNDGNDWNIFLKYYQKLSEIIRESIVKRIRLIPLCKVEQFGRMW